MGCACGQMGAGGGRGQRLARGAQSSDAGTVTGAESRLSCSDLRTFQKQHGGLPRCVWHLVRAKPRGTCVAVGHTREGPGCVCSACGTRCARRARPQEANCCISLCFQGSRCGRGVGLAQTSQRPSARRPLGRSKRFSATRSLDDLEVSLSPQGMPPRPPLSPPAGAQGLAPCACTQHGLHVPTGPEARHVLGLGGPLPRGSRIPC